MLPTEIPPLTLLRDAYHGTGGFTSGAYLVKHRREGSTAYTERQNVSYYLNYLRPVVDSHVTPVFRRESTRTAEGSPLWDAFALDADLGGHSLDQLMREAATPAKLFGIHALVVTAPPEAPATVAEAASLHPYVYHVQAPAITALERDAFGRVQLFRFTEPRMVDGKTETWTRELRADGWSLRDGSGAEQESGIFQRPYHCAPVVLLVAGDWIPGQMLPSSGFYSIARTCTRIFGLCSELDEVLRNQTFSILTYPARDLTDLVIGTNNALGYDPSTTHEPAFIAPAAGPADTIQGQIDRLVREVYRMALLSHQTGTTDSGSGSSNRSGIAMRIDREALDSALSDFAATLEQAEREIAALWGWWTGETIEYSVSYPRDFALQDAETELKPLLDAWTTLADAAVPSLRAGLQTRIASLLLAGDDLRREEVRKELDAGVHRGES